MQTVETKAAVGLCCRANVRVLSQRGQPVAYVLGNPCAALATNLRTYFFHRADAVSQICGHR